MSEIYRCSSFVICTCRPGLNQALPDFSWVLTYLMRHHHQTVMIYSIRQMDWVNQLKLSNCIVTNGDCNEHTKYIKSPYSF